MIKTLSVILISSTLTACGSLVPIVSPTVTAIPSDVSTIPNDCANLPAISRWLEQRSQAAKTVFQSQEQYQQTQSYVKHKLWSLRYNCNPA